MFSADYIAGLLRDLGYYAFIGSILLSTFIAILGIVPSFFVTGANVLVFGPHFGFVISWLGEIIGAWLSFLLYRMGFKKKFEKLGHKHPLLKKITSSEGRKTGILIFQARIIPFIPSGLVTLAAAISNVNIPTFILASAIGKIPTIALEVLVSYDLITIGENWIRLMLTLFSLLIIAILLRK